MNEFAIRDQNWRFLASGAVTLFMIAIILLTLSRLTASLHHMLWGIPVVAVSLLDFYFLTRRLLQQPKKIDTRLSSMLIGLGTVFGFSVIVMFLSAPNAGGEGMADIRGIGGLSFRFAISFGYMVSFLSGGLPDYCAGSACSGGAWTL